MNQIPNAFVLKHTVQRYQFNYLQYTNNLAILDRHDITSISFADIYGIIKSGDWTNLYTALNMVNWFKFDIRNFNHIKLHTQQPTHICCDECRRFLAQLGLFFHKLHYRTFETVHLMTALFDFVMTADNVDLNGILDFEDFKRKSTTDQNTRPSIANTVKIMAPFYQMQYSFYEHVGMYFISSPIYEQIPTCENLLQNFETAVIKSIQFNSELALNHTCRPKIEDLSKFLHLDYYLGLTPERIYDMHNDTTLPELDPYFRVNNINVAITPCIPTNQYVDVQNELNIERYRGQQIHVSIDHRYIANFPQFYSKCQKLEIDIQSLYIKNTPIYTDLHQKSLQIILQLWLRALYDANVNLAHFDSKSYDTTHTAEMPIIGQFDAVPISDCKLCENIPTELRKAYDIGGIIDARANLKTENNDKWNPIVKFDYALRKVGDLNEDSAYEYPLKLTPPHIIDHDLIEYMQNEKNITLKIAPVEINPLHDDPDRTFTSKYYIKSPSESDVRDDLELFNQNYSGSMAPTTLLMAYELLMQLLRETVQPSNGQPNCPMKPDQVYVRNKHKSSGMPYRNEGDSELVRNVYGEFRNALVYHHRHSADQHLTVIINKIATSAKHRDRTILAINSNQSEAGRSLYRDKLEKIKYTAQRGGPILIGFVNQYGGWNAMYEQLYDNFPTENVENIKLGGKDYPKWDRRISNLLQYVSSTAFFSLNDLYQHQIFNESTPGELWHEYIAETTQILNNYMIFKNSIYQKPGGVTSGNSRTADGNSFLHLLIDQYAGIMQLVQSRDDDPNRELYRPLRDFLAQYVLTCIPAEYVQQMPIFNNPEHMHLIRTKIMKGAYLSDDGLLLFDNRIVDYDDFMHESLLLSTYAINLNKTKYHVDENPRKAREFLSQDTFPFGDKVYPIADFERILGAMMMSENRNVHDPAIYVSRHFALYTILYAYYIYYRDEPEHKYILYLDAFREYIDQLTQTFDDADFIRMFEYEGVVDPTIFVGKNVRKIDINEICDRLHGFNLSDAYPAYVVKYQHRYKFKSDAIIDILFENDQQQHKQPILTINPNNDTTCINQISHSNLLCYVCGTGSILTCRVCKNSYCNTKNGISHFVQHIQTSGHRQYLASFRPIICSHCPNSDITNLYYENAQYFCDKHRSNKSFPITNLCVCDTHGVCEHKNTCILYQIDNRDFYAERLAMYNNTHGKQTTYMEFTNYIQTLLTMDFALPPNTHLPQHITYMIKLCDLGITRPYYLLNNRLVLMESNQLDNSQISIPIKTWASVFDDVQITIASNFKLDAHSTYLTYDKNGNEIEIKQTEYVNNDFENNRQTWRLIGVEKIHSPILIQRQLNTLHSLLQTATKSVPQIVDALLSWNTRISTLTHDLPLVREDNFAFTPSLRESMNKLLNTFQQKRFQIIFGAPGTGKSTILSYFMLLCYQLDKKVLVYAPSHQAVNSLLNKTIQVFRENGIRQPGITRIITNDERSQQNRNDSYIRYSQSASKSRDERFVFTTIQSFATVRHVSDFDYVLIDEFSLTQDYYITSAISHLGNSRIIFTGDPRQLSTVDENRAQLDSRFNSIINYYTETFSGEVYVLDGHYRCHPTIFEFFKNHWYPDKNIVCKTTLQNRALPFNITPLNLITIDQPHYQSNGIKRNIDEIEKITKLLKHLSRLSAYDEELERFSISVICSYTSQLQSFDALQKIGKIAPSVILSTIDSAQGGEFDIVILCLTQVNQFTFKDNRLNVAISRAKRSLFITLPKCVMPISNKHIYESLTHIPEYVRHLEITDDTFVENYKMTSMDELKSIQEELTKLDGNSMIQNQSTQQFPANLRDSFQPENVYNPLNIMNPISDDYIYFDTEFYNPRMHKQISTVLSYAAVTTENNRSIRITGNPIYYDYSFRKYPVKFNRRDFVQWWNNTEAKLRKPEDCIQHAAGFNSIAKQIENTSINCDVAYLLDYARQHINAKPTFVTFAGRTDISLLQPIFKHKLGAVCKVPKCAAPAIYAHIDSTANDFYCANHSRTIDNITHFVNIDHWDFSYKHENGQPKLFFSHNGKQITAADLPLMENYKLETIHNNFCTVKHGTAHDPLCDAKMTRCVFKHYRESVLNKYILSNHNLALFQQQRYKLRMFDNQMCMYRRKIQKYWYDEVLDQTVSHCNQGCGRTQLSAATCNFDITQNPNDKQNDINHHECDASVNIFLDSFYYFDGKIKKPSYIFRDINPNHYCQVTPDKVFYLCSKYARYMHGPIHNLIGQDVLRAITTKTDCDKQRTTHGKIWNDLASLPQCVTSAQKFNDKQQYEGVICTTHNQNIELLEMVSQMTYYGYQFLLVKPEDNTTFNQSYPYDFNPLQMQIPGYEQRQPTRGINYMQNKMHCILEQFSKMTNIAGIKLNKHDNIVFAGAASRNGTTPMGDILTQHLNQLQNQIKFVDPNLKFDDGNIHNKQTLDEYAATRATLTQLLISDIYVPEEDQWYHEIEKYVKQHLTLGGSCIFKITCKFAETLPKLDEFARNFTCTTIHRLETSELTSELWVFLTDYYPTVQGWRSTGLEFQAKSLWYQLTQPQINNARTIARPWKINFTFIN